MRVTNKMMTNNMMSNINKNKINMSDLENQYSTGKKIQKPSDDPIVAVRALKLRTNLSEISQYYDKNIPDAESWFDVTESALKNVNDILSQMNTLCVQGANDTLTAEDRESVLKNLVQLKEQIYQEGNSDYAGRYVFTGYKTNTSLVYGEVTKDTTYNIRENFVASDIAHITKIENTYTINDYDANNPNADNFSDSPNMVENYRIQLAYNGLDGGGDIGFKYVDDAGVERDITGITTMASTEVGNGQPGADDVIYLHDTGELLLGDNVYEELKSATSIEVTYEKTNFNKGDLRPEHYFNCTATNNDTGKITEYTVSDQSIEYEINFGQTLKINTQAKDCITHNIGRTIDDIYNAVNAVIATEEQITEVNKKLESTTLTDGQRAALTKLKEQLGTELVLKKSVMQQSFETGNSATLAQQNTVNVATSDLGSRYVRLNLTKTRLSDQKVDFEELMSNNEDADLVETIIKFSSAETVYNSSLSAASKVVQNTLLDFL